MGLVTSASILSSPLSAGRPDHQEKTPISGRDDNDCQNLWRPMLGSSIGQPPTALIIDELTNALDMGKFLSLPGEILLRGEKALENLERVLKVAAARRAAQEADEAAKSGVQAAKQRVRTRSRRHNQESSLEFHYAPPLTIKRSPMTVALTSSRHHWSTS